MYSSLLAIITSLAFTFFPAEMNALAQATQTKPEIKVEGLSIAGLIPNGQLKQKMKMGAIRKMLNQKQVSMSPAAKSYVLNALHCADKKNLGYKHILTVIDYSKPSSQKRLWVFDLDKKNLLYKTYVSHGIKTGILNSDLFSNTHNSKASSLGVFLTKQSYFGRHGLAMRLRGLEAGFNDHAGGRAIVMHGGWYMEEPFVKKYGRPGRSWGCPAIPKSLSKKIIHTIQDDGLLISYYPSEDWLLNSRYLNCDKLSINPHTQAIKTDMNEFVEGRSDILFVEKNNNNAWDQYEPVVVIKADDYITAFNAQAPLKRMLRRQIKNEEYIALNRQELNTLLHDENFVGKEKNIPPTIHFVIPHVKTHHGRYLGTEMRIISLGDIKKIDKPEVISEQSPSGNYLIHFENKKPLELQSTNEFIRWLGL